MGVNCCSHEKEAPEIVIQKPERNINLVNKNSNNSQAQNDLIIVNSTQNSQLRSSSPEYEQKIMYQSYETTQSMSPPSNINYQNVEYQYSPQVNQSTGGIIPINESNNIIYETQNLNQNNKNIQSQNVISQNENIITNNQSPVEIHQQIINSTQGVLDSNQNQYNPQVNSQVITVSQNISNQYTNEPFKLDLFSNDNTNSNINPLGFNKNEIDNIFDSAFKSLGFPGNDAPSNSQNVNNQQISFINQNQQSDTNVNFDELLKQQISQQQSRNGGNGLNIDELLKQQNSQQQSGGGATNVNINDLIMTQNDQQTGMGLNMDELLKPQSSQINDQLNNLYFENQNGLNTISKSVQLPSPNTFQSNINMQQDPLLYSLNPPNPVNISNSIQLGQYNSPIKIATSEPISPSNQYNNIQQII